MTPMSQAAARRVVDVTNCDREPIHLSGAIQPHGILLTLEPEHFRVVQASENILAMFGVGPLETIGYPVEALLGPVNAELIRAAAAGEEIECAYPVALTLRTIDGDAAADALLHRSGDAIVVEIEAIDNAALISPYDFARLTRRSLEAFAGVHNVQELCDAAVSEVAGVTGFDRVMMYRFDVDWHGEVIAERHAPGMEPFLGLHYPASDIPRQAREIFTRNWLRFIPDVGYVPAAIVPALTPAGEPLDLTGSVLRSVSPLHIEYLQNMNVGATLTISVLKDGLLWGLIACHHRTPRRIPLQRRVVSEHIGRTVSLALGTIEEEQNLTYRALLRSGQLRLLAALSEPADIWTALASAEPDLLALVGSEGAAIRFGNDCRLVGRTPALADVMAITDWLAANEADDVFLSDQLPIIEPAFERFAQTASGIMAFALSRAKRSYILWFRPETPLSVTWGGDPRKSTGFNANAASLTPRKSFASWTQIVRRHSRSWTACEVEVAREWCRFVGTLIVDRAVDRAEELERANRGLEVANVELASLLRSNIELDSFAHIASHDLKEPLRGIHNYASFLVEDYGSVVGADGRDKLETLVRLSRRMEALIDSLLALSSIGRAEFVGSPTNLSTVIDEALELHRPRLTQSGGGVSIVTPLPRVYVDGVRLGQVFNNLFANALKYSERPPHIEVGCDPAIEPPPSLTAASLATSARRKYTTVFVRDNGIGIRPKHLTSIFQMFKRLNSGDAYGGGTGAGLAIAKKIIERHGGQMWAESVFGTGTTFFFTLPTEP